MMYLERNQKSSLEEKKNQKEHNETLWCLVQRDPWKKYI